MLLYYYFYQIRTAPRMCCLWIVIVEAKSLSSSAASASVLCIFNDFFIICLVAFLILLSKICNFFQIELLIQIITGWHLWYQRWDLYFWSRASPRCWYHYAFQSVYAAVPQDLSTRYFKHLTWCSILPHLCWLTCHQVTSLLNRK